MNNPYEVLGISPSATDAEVKSAYRAMAKKYHPDNYANSPLNDLAEQKMKEVNEAYDKITEQRKNGESTGGSYSGYNSTGNNTQFYNVRVNIQNGKLYDAEAILDAVPITGRNAEWYFLKGMIFYKKGWSQQAYQYFSTAHSMEPGNAEYAQAFNRMNSQRTNPTGGYNTGSTVNDNCTCCDVCNTLMCANCCCNCMGGGC